MDVVHNKIHPHYFRRHHLYPIPYYGGRYGWQAPTKTKEPEVTSEPAIPAFKLKEKPDLRKAENEVVVQPHDAKEIIFNKKDDEKPIANVLPQCTKVGDVIPDPSSICRYLRCTYASEWKDQQGNMVLRTVTRNCPVGLGVNKSDFNRMYPCNLKTNKCPDECLRLGQFLPGSECSYKECTMKSWKNIKDLRSEKLVKIERQCPVGVGINTTNFDAEFPCNVVNQACEG